MAATVSSYETPKTQRPTEELTTEAAVIGESMEKVVNESDSTADAFVPWSVLHLDDEDDDLQLDYEDYYILDDSNDIRRLTDSDEDLKKSLIVLFHVGLWRACPFLLRGQLPASVGQTLITFFSYHFLFLTFLHFLLFSLLLFPLLFLLLSPSFSFSFSHSSLFSFSILFFALKEGFVSNSNTSPLYIDFSSPDQNQLNIPFRSISMHIFPNRILSDFYLLHQK